MPTFPFSVEHAESKEEKSTKRLNEHQPTPTEIQATPTDLVQPSSDFLSTPDDHNKLYRVPNPNKQHSLFIEQRLNERQQKQKKQYESTENKSQKESVKDGFISKYFIAANKPSING